MVESCDHPPKTIIEIGTYLGRYIAYLASHYDLHATALDYNSDQVRIKNAFKAMKVDNYQLIQADFLEFEPMQQYDLVVSIGFIEHFQDYDSVLDKHAQLLAPGGSMIIMIPNKRYFRKWYGWLVDYKNLKAHNLECMNTNTFERFAVRNSLNIQHLDYYGGFPYAVHQELNTAQKIIYKITRKLFLSVNPFIQKYPNRFLSSTIIAILHKQVIDA